MKNDPDSHPHEQPGPLPTEAPLMVLALLARIQALLPGVALELQHIEQRSAVAFVRDLAHEIAIIEWDGSTRRWTTGLRLRGANTDAAGVRALAIVPRNDLDAACIAHSGKADAVVWHDDGIGLDRALARLLRIRATPQSGSAS